MRLASSEYIMLICTITICIINIICKFAHVSHPRHIGARVGPRGSTTWPCMPHRIHAGPAQ